VTATGRAPAARPDGRPLVSVCVPAFNGAPYIGDALRSVLEQSLEDCELIVIDDGSSDGTADVVATIRDERVRLMRNPIPLGLVGNWNRCLDLARGRHVTVFHQDDLMAPDNLASKVRFLEEHPTVGLVHSNVAQIDAHGGLLSEWWDSPPRPEDEGRHDGMAYFHRLVTGINIICAPSVVMRRTVFEQLGGFDPQLPFTADWEMWLRIALFYDVGYLAQPLVSYRRHDGMETVRLSWSQQLEQKYLAKMLVLEKHPDRVPDVEALGRRISQEYRDRALARSRTEFEEGRPGPAGQYLAVALAVCERMRHGPSADGYDAAVREVFAALGGFAGSGAWREEFDARLRQAETGAERAGALAEELARTIDDRDRLIDAMVRTRAWRTAQKWWSLKDAVGRLLRRT
jgi:Glycosyl transferase family 2